MASSKTEIRRLTPGRRLIRGAMVQTASRVVNESETATARVGRHAGILSGQLRALGTTLFPPTASKNLRSFSSGEVARIVGVSDGYLRQLSLDGLGPLPTLASGGRRSYTLTQVNELRRYLADVRPREALE